MADCRYDIYVVRNELSGFEACYWVVGLSSELKSPKVISVLGLNARSKFEADPAVYRVYIL
jgi:hypothetical protein